MKRLGKINITREFIQANPDAMVQIFSFMKFCVIDVERNIRIDTFTYTGTSHLFEELSDAAIIPEYSVSMNVNQDSGKPVIDGIEVKLVDITLPRLGLEDLFDLN